MLALSPQIILHQLCFQCLQCVNTTLSGQFRFIGELHEVGELVLEFQWWEHYRQCGNLAHSYSRACLPMQTTLCELQCTVRVQISLSVMPIHSSHFFTTIYHSAWPVSQRHK